MGNKVHYNYRNTSTTQYTLLSGKFKTSMISGGTFVESKVRLGADNPNYKNHIRLGKSVTNALNVLIHYRKIENGAAKMRFVKAVQLNQVSWCYNPGIPSLLGVVFPTSPDNAALLADAKNLAAIGIRKKIQAQVQTWSGPEFLGELREAIRGIRHPTESLLAYAASFQFTRNGIKKRFPNRQFGKALAATHLEFQFGVLPLIGEITNIANAALFKSEENSVKRFSYRSKVELAFDHAPYSFGAGGITTVKYDSHKGYNVGYQYIVGLKRENSATRGLDGIISQGGFVEERLISTLWEISPLTVFIDYVVNIGEVLNLGLMSLTNVIWTNNSSKQLLHQTFYNPRCASNANIREEVPSATKVTNIVQRIVRTADAIAIPQLRFELPTKPKRLANLAAFFTLIHN